MPVTPRSDLRQNTINRMPNWERIQALIPSTIPITLLEYAQTHESTRSKISFAEYHYDYISQMYRPDATPRESDTQDWVLAETHAVVANLYSALDSLANEVNLAYGYGIDPSKINIHHAHASRQTDCIRCAIDGTDDSLTTFINTGLSQPWFDTFRKLRNQMIHKVLPVTMVHIRIGDETTQILLPDDPANTNPQVEDYSLNREISTYCRDTIAAVTDLIEGAYPLILTKVRVRYGT